MFVVIFTQPGIVLSHFGPFHDRESAETWGKLKVAEVTRITGDGGLAYEVAELHRPT